MDWVDLFFESSQTLGVSLCSSPILTDCYEPAVQTIFLTYFPNFLFKIAISKMSDMGIRNTNDSEELDGSGKAVRSGDSSASSEVKVFGGPDQSGKVGDFSESDESSRLDEVSKSVGAGSEASSDMAESFQDLISPMRRMRVGTTRRAGPRINLPVFQRKGICYCSVYLNLARY